MPIGSVSAASSAQSLQSNGLGVQDFLKILLTQLTNQDPLKPMDNQQFMAQMAQFTSLQQTQELNSKMEQLIVNQSSLQSVGLIGHNVDISVNGSNLTGKVVSLSLTGEAPLLTVTTTNGATLSNISLSQISAVR